MGRVEYMLETKYGKCEFDDAIYEKFTTSSFELRRCAARCNDGMLSHPPFRRSSVKNERDLTDEVTA